MALLKKREGYTVIGISAAGGVFHNVGQLLVAMAVVESFAISGYLPVLLIAGLLTGLLIGILAGQMLKRLTNIRF